MRLTLLPLILAWRDGRGGLGSLWVVVVQVTLAVAMMTSIGAVGGAALDSITVLGREAAGGDLSLRLFHAPASPDQMARLTRHGPVSTVAELRPTAEAPNGGRTLVELKAVDAAYPLYGAATVSGAMPLHAALARENGAWGAVVDPALLARLGLSIGDRLRLGALWVKVRATLIHEPDRALRALSLGPRVIVTQEALAESGLAPPGAPVYWYHRLRLPDEHATAPVIDALTRHDPDAGWRIVDGRQGLPGAERTVTLARTLFLLIALAVVLIGGMGIGHAARAHAERRLPTAATLKGLGGRPRTVFWMLAAQITAAALVAGILGGGLGLGGAWVALSLAPDWIAAAASAWQPGAVGMAMAVGLVATLAFSVRPLFLTAACPPPAIWREASLNRLPGGWRPRLIALGLGGGLVALMVVWTGMAAATLAMLGACLLAAGLFHLHGRGLAHAARGLARRRRGAARLALAALGRPGAPTVPVATVLGLALTLMVAVGMTGQAALRHMADTVPAQAPDAVALALPADPEADAALRARLSALPGVTRVETAPFLHARISRLNGTPITERDVPRSIAWAVRGDRGLSWRAAPRPGTELTAGHWWAEDHDGPLLAAVDAKVAGRLSLALGDTLTLATPAGPLTATVAVLRRMDWTALELDFPIILSPPATPPPHSRVAALWMEAGTAPAVERAVTDTSPHSAVLPLAPILESLGQTVRQVRDLMAGVSIIALAAALVVLAAAILASARARRRDMAILKAIGVSPRQITRALTLEFMLLGFGVAALAVPLGTAAGVAVTLAVTGSGAAVDGVFPVIAFLTTPALLAAAGAALARRGHRFSAATELRLATAE